MDSELVSGSLSDGGGTDKSYPLFDTYTEYFNYVFPYYLSIGMTYDLFWNGDSSLVKYYRQAQELIVDRRNQELWLQGLYVYEAICDAAPLFNPMGKKGAKAKPYVEEPFPITDKQRKKAVVEKEKRIAAKGKRLMENLRLSAEKRHRGGTTKT